MSYIYHLIPEPMQGNHLMALNEMDRESELYKRHARKYEGREDLMDEQLPLLNCKWNDVVQFSGLDPRVIVAELQKYQTDLVITRKSFYRVPISVIIERHEAVIFDRDTTREKGSFEVFPHEVKVLGPENYTELTEVPEKTIEYWKRVKEEGGKFLFFPFITHVMVKGRIDTSGFEIFHF